MHPHQKVHRVCSNPGFKPAFKARSSVRKTPSKSGHFDKPRTEFVFSLFGCCNDLHSAYRDIYIEEYELLSRYVLHVLSHRIYHYLQCDDAKIDLSLIYMGKLFFTLGANSCLRIECGTSLLKTCTHKHDSCYKHLPHWILICSVNEQI